MDGLAALPVLAGHSWSLGLDAKLYPEPTIVLAIFHHGNSDGDAVVVRRKTGGRDVGKVVSH